MPIVSCSLPNINNYQNMQSTLKKTNIFIKIEYALLSKGHPKPRLLHLDVLLSCGRNVVCLYARFCLTALVITGLKNKKMCAFRNVVFLHRSGLNVDVSSKLGLKSF